MFLVSSKLRSLLAFRKFLRPTLQKTLVFILTFCLGLGTSLLVFKMTTVEIPILGFHDIIDLSNPEERPPQRPPQDGDYTKQDLAVFLEYLAKNNYWFLSAPELYDYFLSDNKKPIPKERKKQKPIMLAFDDGYKSAHKNILAVLEDIEQHNGQKLKVVWFINPAFLGLHGSQLDRISCEDLRTGLKKGYYDIQSHGLNHLNLTQIDSKKLDRELKLSQQELRDCTKGLDPDNRVASQIAYPFGAVNPQVEKQVARYYLTGYLYNSRILRPTYLKNKYLIPRLSVAETMSVARLKLLAAGGWL